MGLPARERAYSTHLLTGAPGPEETCMRDCPKLNSLTVDPARKKARNRSCCERRRNEMNSRESKKPVTPHLLHFKLYERKHFNFQ